MNKISIDKRRREGLQRLIETIIKIEEYELCHQIHHILNREENQNGICHKCSLPLGEEGICWRCLTK